MVREATKEDLDRINEMRRMVNDIHVEGRPDIFRPGFGREIQEHAANYLEWENNNILVAERDGIVCGFVMVDYVDRPENAYNLARKFIHVSEIGVDERFRRQGVATELIEGMKEDARKRGFRRIELDVWAFNDALAFYEAVGFKVFRRFMEYEIDEA